MIIINLYVKKMGFFLFLAGTLCVCLSINCRANNEQTVKIEVEQLLGISLPEQSEDIQFSEIPANTEFRKPFTSVTYYIRAKMSKNDYLDFISELDMTLNKTEQNEYTLLLMTELQQREYSPAWWTPDPVPNELSGAGSLPLSQTQSWLISTYDKGYAYFQAYESGLQN